MNKKGSNKYIEYLDEDGWHLIPDTSAVKKKSKKQWFLVLLLPLFLFPVFKFTYSSYVSSSHGDPNIKVATWKFEINSNTTKLGIDLADTIIPNNFSNTVVVPGTSGKIDLEVDFSSTKVATEYVIAMDTATTVVPDNLKFYSDVAMSQEFAGFQGEILLKDIDRPLIKTIYWKWDYTTDDETVDWSNEEIILNLVATASQKLS